MARDRRGSSLRGFQSRACTWERRERVGAGVGFHRVATNLLDAQGRAVLKKRRNRSERTCKPRAHRCGNRIAYSPRPRSRQRAVGADARLSLPERTMRGNSWRWTRPRRRPGDDVSSDATLSPRERRPARFATTLAIRFLGIAGVLPPFLFGSGSEVDCTCPGARTRIAAISTRFACNDADPHPGPPPHSPIRPISQLCQVRLADLRHLF